MRALACVAALALLLSAFDRRGRALGWAAWLGVLMGGLYLAASMTAGRPEAFM